MDPSAKPFAGARDSPRDGVQAAKHFWSPQTHTQRPTFRARLFMDRRKVNEWTAIIFKIKITENAKSYVSLFMEATAKHLRLTDDRKKSYFAYLHNNGQGSGSWLVTLAEKCLPYNQPTTLLL